MHTHMEHRAPRVEASRRELFGFGGAVVAIPAAVAVGATAIADAASVAPDGPSSFRRAETAYKFALARYNALPIDIEHTDHAYQREEAQLIDALTALEEAPIADWQEFAAVFRHCTCDGQMLLSAEVQNKLLADAKRLAGEA